MLLQSIYRRRVLHSSLAGYICRRSYLTADGGSGLTGNGGEHRLNSGTRRDEGTLKVGLARWCQPKLRRVAGVLRAACVWYVSTSLLIRLILHAGVEEVADGVTTAEDGR